METQENETLSETKQEVSETKPEVLTQKTKDKLKIWLSDKYNFVFVGIFIFAVIIRLYYFFLTKSQPLWWDEADYLAYAKNLAGFDVDWIVTPEHKSVLSFLMAAFFKFGLSETGGKFIVQVIPSILTVFLVYFIVIEMYEDKRIALIATFLAATFWSHLFDSMRFHVDVTGLFTGLLAIYVFWHSYENKKYIFGKISHKWAVPITTLLVMLTYSIRRGHFIFGVFFLVYMLSTRKWKELAKDKFNWLSLAIVLPILFLMEKTIFASQDVGFGAVSTYFQSELPITFLPLQVFSAYFESLVVGPNILLYLFYFGFIISLSGLIFSFGYMKGTNKSFAKPDLFNVIVIVFTVAFFVYVIRAQNAFGEPRWYFPLLLSSLVIISRGTLVITDLIKLYNKHLALIILVVLIGFGGYYEVKHADLIIKNRAESFEGIRQAGLFLKEISDKNDLIIVKPEPQTMYYSERKAIQPTRWLNWDDRKRDELPFELVLKKIRETPEAKYIVVSFSEPNHPPWMQTVRQTQSGGTIWEIPFMQTKVNFGTGEQDIKQSVSYDDITFKLLDIKKEVFIYEIIRN